MKHTVKSLLLALPLSAIDAAALHAADTLTCALAHVEESVPCSAAASIQLPLWELSRMAGVCRAPP